MLVELTRSFRAMNTAVEAVVCVLDGEQAAGEAALAQIQDRFEMVEERLSRFRPESELSHLNASAGHPFKASPLLFKVVDASLAASRATGGLFDPTILRSLMAAGYDRSFEQLAGYDDDGRVMYISPQFNWQDVRLDCPTSTICMPGGCSLDLGGIGKGWTVDQACLRLQGFPGYAVDAGGDIRVGGRRADGAAWTIGVSDPFDEDSNLQVFEMGQGAVCTSTTARRRWFRAGNLCHHLIDPRTGMPAASGVVSATVIARSAAHAEVIAKAALVLGAEAGIRLIERQTGTRGLLVLEDHHTVCSTGFEAVVHAA